MNLDAGDVAYAGIVERVNEAGLGAEALLEWLLELEEDQAVAVLRQLLRARTTGREAADYLLVAVERLEAVEAKLAARAEAAHQA